MLYDYADHLKARGAAKKSQRAPRDLRLKLIKESPWLLELDAHTLRKEDVHIFQAAMNEDGLMVSTSNKYLRILRAALNWYTDEETHCRFKMGREGKKVRYALDLPGVRRLLKIGDARIRAILALALYTGLRHQEIMHLQWCDIDFDTEDLAVTAKGSWKPKSISERRVPMPPPLLKYLLSWLASARLNAGKRDENKTMDDIRLSSAWLFPSKSAPDKPAFDARDDVNTAFAKLDPPVPKKHDPGFRMLRRTYATRLAGQGVDLETLRVLMGHQSSQTTATYVCTTPARAKLAVAGLNYDEEEV